MKRKLLFGVIGLSILAITGCESKDVINANLDPYVYDYTPVFEDEHDSNIYIDGHLEEPNWLNKNYLSFSEYNVDIKVTSFFTDFGVYVGGEIKDSEMTYYGRFDTKNNSGIDIYLARNDQMIMQYSEIMRLQLDAYDRKSYYQDRFAGQAYVEGEMNTHTVCTMTFEIFVSWKELGYTDFHPKTIKMVPSYRYIYKSEAGTNIERHNITPTFCESTYMSGYFTFNKDGYANKEIPDCQLGNAMNGVSKSDGWDISHYKDPVPYVESNFRNVQSIYFKNVYSENFIAEVDCELVAPLGSSNNPKMGLIAHGYGFMNFRAMYLRAIVDNKNYYDSKTLRLAEMTYYPNRTYVENDYIFQELSSSLITGENKIHLKMIKKNDTLAFFAQGKLVYTETAEWYKGKMSPGLFAMDADAKFYNYRAVSLSDEELFDYLEDADISWITIPSSFNGGRIKAKDNAISFGNPLSLDIIPNVGYILSDLKINNESYFEDYCNKVNDAKYVTSNLPRVGELNISATFKKIATKSGPYVFGNLVSSKDSSRVVSYANIKITSHLSLLYFNDTSSSNGSYYFDYLPSKGSEVLSANGKSYVADGYYHLFITANGYRPFEIDLYVDDDGVHIGGPSGNIVQDNYSMHLDPRVVGGSVSSNNFSYNSDLTGWDLSQEHLNIVRANRGSSNNPLYFSDVVSTKAVIKMTVQDNNPINEVGYDPQPSFGISMQTGGFRLGVILDGTNVRLLPDFQWYNDSQHLIYGNGLFRTNDKKPIDYMLVKDGTFVACLVSPNRDGDYQIAYAGVWEDFGNLPVAFGLYSRSSGLVDSTFSNYSIDTSSSVVNNIVDKYLTNKIIISNGENGNVTVKDGNGHAYVSGDSIKVGSTVVVNAVANNGYFVYGIRNNNTFTDITYSDNYKNGTSIFSYSGGPIEILYKPISELKKDLSLSITPQATASHLETICDSTENVSGLSYVTNPNLGNDSLECNVQIAMGTQINDYSDFTSIEYEIIEGFSDEKMVPYLVDGGGHVFKIGGKRNEWKATRQVGDLSSVVSSSNWQGFPINGGYHASYTVDLKTDMYFDKDVSAKFGSSDEAASIDLEHIKYLGIQNYAYKAYKWNYTLIAIRGVKSDGSKEMLFDASQANVKPINSDISAIAGPNDAFFFYQTNNGVNYQYIEAISNKEVKVMSPDSRTWEINFSDSDSGYAWCNLNWSGLDSHVNLSFYDAIVFNVDFTVGDWGNCDKLEFQIELRYDNYNIDSKCASRNNFLYLIHEDGTIEKAKYDAIPTSFKGQIVCLFEDFTSISLLNDHLFNIMTQSRFIFKTTSGTDGVKFDMWGFTIVANGKQLIYGNN